MADKKHSGIATPARIARVERGPHETVLLMYVTAEGPSGLVLTQADAVSSGVRLLQEAAASDDDPLAFPVEGVEGSISEEDSLVLNFTLGGRYLPLALKRATVAALKAVLAEYEGADPPVPGKSH